jgi:hypothetical protein
MFRPLFTKIREFWQKSKAVKQLENLQAVQSKEAFPPTIGQRIEHSADNEYTIRRRRERKRTQPMQKKSRMYNFLHG